MVSSHYSFSQQPSLDLIPYPQQIKPLNSQFDFKEPVTIILDKGAGEAVRFAAEELKDRLKNDFIQEVSINQKNNKTIRLTKKGTSEKIGNEGYELTVADNSITIKARGDAGLFYGVQTLLQLVKKTSEGLHVPGVDIKDWPSTKVRAMHYDTKHHQDTREYVEDLIRKFASYKVNMLVWEWEDKMAYEQHPEIGAPGAFTIKEIQEITKYARQRHIEIVPLVQGLGHASFILKWPQNAGAREIYASNFEFCPLKDSTYKILFSLWDEAIRATPGSEYIHIGSDETYELGACSRCKKKAEEIGVSGLYHLFIDKAATYLEKSGRKIMAWESPMNWKQGKNADKNITPHKGLVLTESYSFETADLKYAKQAKSLGYPVFAYDPNPGIEHLFLPYFFKHRDGKKITGSLKESYDFLTSTLSKGVFDGVIRTSWDDSGLPMQSWMMQFVAGAAFSWNANAPGLEDFTQSFFSNYFGDTEENLQHMFLLLNEGSYYYSSTLERWVWHEGAIGKTHLPDLPRGDAVEYDPYWNIQYAQQVKQAELFLKKMDTALQIGNRNLSLNIRNKFDIQIFNSLAELIRHTAQTYLDLSSVENNITLAHKQRFLNHDSVVYYLKLAENIVQGQISRKDKLYDHIVKLWEQTRLPKGLSTPDKKYFFRQDRTRHYANRTADLKYLLVDEDDLKLEEYLLKLIQYRKDYETAFMQNEKETIRDPWNNKFTFNQSIAQIERGTFVSRPKEIDDVLNNPGIGFTTFQRFNGDTLTTLDNNLRWTEGYPIVYQSYKGTLNNKNHPATSIAYWRVYWRFVQPEKGKYRWDMIDSALELAQQRKQTLMLRIAPYGTVQANGDGPDVPKWYREMVGPKLEWKYNNPVNRWVVDAEDPRYVQYFGGFIKELGKRYDGHPALEAVDLSIVGAWGEGGGSALLSEKTRADLVHAYTDNFKKTPLLALITDEATNKVANEGANVGWRVDCIGDLGFWAKDQNGWTHMYDYYPQSIVRNGLEDTWKKAPVSLEICGTLYRWKTQEKYTEKQVKYIFDQTLKWHISSFNAKSSPVPPEWEPLVKEWLKKMGYRFVLRKFSCKSIVKPNERLDIETWWENKGVAPCYKPYAFAIGLKNAKDSATFIMDADIRKWLPGDIIYDNSITIPSNISAGEYEVQVAIVDRLTLKPAVQLAIEGKRADGWYGLGNITIEK